MHYLLKRTVHQGMPGVSLENEIFKDLDFVDDVALFTEMSDVLILVWQLCTKKWQRLTLRLTDAKPSSSNPAIHPQSSCSTVEVAAVVDSFVYLGSMIDFWWQQRSGLVEDKCCSDSHEFTGKVDLKVELLAEYLKIWLCKTYAVLMYSCETWATTYLCARTYTWHMGITEILRIPYSRHIPNVAVSQCPQSVSLSAWDSLVTWRAVLPMKTITIQLLLWLTSPHLTGNVPQEDPIKLDWQLFSQI